MKNASHYLFGIFIVLLGCTIGCSSDDTVAPNPTTAPVDLTVGFSKVVTRTSFLKTMAVDSMKIDSVIVVLQKIKFESHIDDVIADSTGQDTTVNAAEANFTFKGPFMIHVRDSMTVNFANQTLPAGRYTGIKYKIHTFKKGEFHLDSDDRTNRKGWFNNDSMAGYSIAVWGTIKKDGAWIPFAFKTAVEVEYKLRGDFTISGSTSTITMALKFNTGDWFTNLTTGVMLDPTDTSTGNTVLIKQAIRKSFEKGRGGRDDNRDGNPDA